jgi:hypothetical protein
MIPPETGLTPRGLAAMLLIIGLVAALFGARPLDDWAADTITAPEFSVLRQVIGDWRETTGGIGLDRPYEAVRSATRALEARRF